MYFWLDFKSRRMDVHDRFCANPCRIVPIQDTYPPAFLPDTIKNGTFTLVVVVLLITGLYLVISGITSTTGTFIT